MLAAVTRRHDELNRALVHGMRPVVVALDDPDDEAAYLPELLADGYDLRVREPGHRCLRGAVGDLPVNLHCYAQGGPEITR